MDKYNEASLYKLTFYSAIKRNKKDILLHATTWKNLENIMLSEGSQAQKATYYTILFI